MESWADHCLDCAERRRRYALSKFRMARLFRSPQMLAEGKALMREAGGGRMMFELSFPQDRCWKITAQGSDYFLREYNDEITGYSDGLRELAPDVIQYSGNAYYVTGKFAQQQGWIVEQCPRDFVPKDALSERKKDEGDE